MDEELEGVLQPPEAPGGDADEPTPPGTLTPERLAQLLAYCKLTELADDPEVQTLIPVFYAAAVGYMENAGINVPNLGTSRAAQYDLCVSYLVLDAWDHRDMSLPVTATAADNPAFRRLITQLKLT